jgi:FAD/FMN-containing dehydrogenase
MVEAEVDRPVSIHHCVECIAAHHTLIARGLGRSYGDSSLSTAMLDTCYLDHFLSFDADSGLVACSAGVTLDDILRIFVPKGWFLPVTPGTRYVTVGGAIAGDVHGKNHHVEGCFSDHVVGMELLLGNGERLMASPETNEDLFHATCGGMGLTGVIVSATIRLKPIRSSTIKQTTIKTPDLDTVLAAFEEHHTATYSVAWIDCLAKGKHLGRSLLMLGEHAEEGGLRVWKKKPVPVPVDLPGFLMNQLTVKTFNTLYYGRVRKMKQESEIPYTPFFYPLDALDQWNRLYGKGGFVQYQFVLPKSSGIQGLQRILERIANSGKASFLAVLKVFGAENRNHLSFPMEGYTLALDFKAEPTLFKLLEELDHLVVEYGGRINLTKDARMNADVFQAGYPRLQEFEAVREKYHARGKFCSLQSKRLGLP